VRTFSQTGGKRMRELNIRSREKLTVLVEAGDSAGAESFWRKHLEQSGKVVFSAYQGGKPIDMVPLPEADQSRKVSG